MAWTNTSLLHRVRTTTTTTTTGATRAHFVSSGCHVWRTRYWSRSKAARAADALVVASRAAQHRRCRGCTLASQRTAWFRQPRRWRFTSSTTPNGDRSSLHWGRHLCLRLPGRRRQSRSVTWLPELPRSLWCQCRTTRSTMPHCSSSSSSLFWLAQEKVREEAEVKELEEKVARKMQRLSEEVDNVSRRDKFYLLDKLSALERAALRPRRPLRGAQEEQGEEEEEEEEEMNVAVSVQLLLMTSFTILSSHFLCSVSGCCLTSSGLLGCGDIWMVSFFWWYSTAPCIWQSLVRRCLCLRSTSCGLFWEMTSAWTPYSAFYLVRQWIQVYVSLRRLLENFTCRARRRHWQWYVLAGCAGYDTPRAVIFDVDVRGDSTGAVLGQGDMPVWCFCQTAQKTVDFLQLLSSLVVDIPVMVQRPIPMVLLFSGPRDSAVAVRVRGDRCPCCAGRVPAGCCAIVLTMRIPLRCPFCGSCAVVDVGCAQQRSCRS